MKNKYFNIKQLVAAVLFIMGGLSVTFAQDIPLNHLYNRYKYAVNPAALNINKGIGANLNYANNQFSEINPIQKFGIGVDGGFLFDNMAIGLYLSREEQNILHRTNAQLSYAYRLTLSNENFLTFGLSAGLAVQGINANMVYQGSGFDMSDPALDDTKSNAVFGLGINYTYKAFEFDLAAPYYSLINKNNVPLFASVSYAYQLENNNWTLKPQVMYNSVLPAQNFADVRVQGIFKEKYWVEAGYRSTNELLVGVGTELSNFRFDYMCGLNVGKFRHTNNGIHELVVAYRFKNTKLDRKDSRAVRNEKALEVLTSEIEEIKEDGKETTRSIGELNQSVKKLNEDINEELKGQLSAITETVQSLQKDEVTYVDETTIRSTSYFVIVFSTTTIDDAERIVERMKKQGETGQIISHTKRKHYFIYTQVRDNLNDALETMNEERKKGYNEAWVLVVK